MKRFRATHFSASSIICIAALMSACSGGGGSAGGGGVGGPGTPPATPTPSAPTPTPTSAPTPAPSPASNDDLIAPLVSESFVNDGGVANGSFPTSGATPTLSAASQPTTFSYDAGRNSYTIAAGSRTVTFLPSDRDAALSNSAVTVYAIRSGSTTDTLTLTNPGTSGRFTFRYVGGGYWQRTVESADVITGSINAVTYGVPSPAAAIPASGRAEYQLDFIGAMTLGGAPQGFTGAGVLQIDLGTGRLTVSGGFGPSGSGADFQASGALASGSGHISGSFSAYAGGPSFITGQVDGRFYGPGSEEVGGTFAGASSGLGASAVVGSFMGRGATIPNLPFEASHVNSVSAGVSATVGGGAVSGAAGRDMPMEVRYDTVNDTYTLINAERSFTGKAFTEAKFAGDSDTVTTSNPLDLQHVKAIQWTDRRQVGTQNRYYVTESVFGSRTADGDVPRTGNAGYLVSLSGTLAENGASDLIRTIGGGGQLFLDFSTGQIETNGVINNGAPMGSSFRGTSQLSSSANSFAGTLNMANGSSYSGNWNGGLYGPGGVELGSAFTLTNAAGGVFAGTLTGKANPDLTLDKTRLLDLTATTSFQTLLAFRDGTVTRTLGPGAASVVTYNPATGQYDLALNQHASTNLPDVQLRSDLRDAGASNATFDAYAVQLTNSRTYDVTARVLRPGSTNPTIVLNYISFADLSYRWESPPGNNQYFDFSTVFGMITPTLQMPRTGTASYAGIARGSAQTYTNAGGLNYYALSGTSQFDFDFQAFQMSGSLALTGANKETGATRDFGSLAFTGNGPGGNVGPATFFGNFTSIPGSINGSFFGPRGPELGAVFTVDQTGGPEQIRMNGATVATRQP